MLSEIPFTPREMKAGAGLRGSTRYRAALTEWLDGPCRYEELRRCLHDLGHIGILTGAQWVILRWLNRFSGSATTLRVLDAGCGGGHLLRRVEQWAAARRIPVVLTGIDLNPDAIRAAREFTPAGSAIHWVAGDAASFDEPVDLIVSSYVAHHLEDDGIVRFLRWMERTALRGWLIHDLYRSRVAVASFRAMAWAAQWHPFVRQDGAISIRRAFLPEEWRRYIDQAGIAAGAVRVSARWPVRICVSHEKES